jgi:hypothetical protein
VNMIKKKLEYSIDICTQYCMTWKNIQGWKMKSDFKMNEKLKRMKG